MASFQPQVLCPGIDELLLAMSQQHQQQQFAGPSQFSAQPPSTSQQGPLLLPLSSVQIRAALLQTMAYQQLAWMSTSSLLTTINNGITCENAVQQPPTLLQPTGPPPPSQNMFFMPFSHANSQVFRRPPGQPNTEKRASDFEAVVNVWSTRAKICVKNCLKDENVARMVPKNASPTDETPPPQFSDIAVEESEQRKEKKSTPARRDSNKKRQRYFYYEEIPEDENDENKETGINETQENALEMEFARKRSLPYERKQTLAREFHLTEAQVRDWFKSKREGKTKQPASAKVMKLRVNQIGEFLDWAKGELSGADSIAKRAAWSAVQDLSLQAPAEK